MAIESSGDVETVAIVLAGGVGSRFGGPTPKQLLKLAGHSVLHHALRKFDASAVADRLLVAANINWLDEISEICASSLRRTPFEIVDGGTERNLSVRNAVVALGDLPDAYVLVHDGVRPLVTPELITAVRTALETDRCVIPVVPSADPLVAVQHGEVVGFEDRNVVLRGQSPQGFRLVDLRASLVDRDDVEHFPTVFEAVLSALPETRITTVSGEVNNIKVTTEIDRVIAGRLLLEE